MGRQASANPPTRKRRYRCPSRSRSPRMRIVHVVLTLNIGGQERLILNLSRELVWRGDPGGVISLAPGGGLRRGFGGGSGAQGPAGEPAGAPRFRGVGGGARALSAG